jgi:protein SCO1
MARWSRMHTRRVWVGALSVVLAGVVVGGVVHATTAGGTALVGANLGREPATDFRLRDSEGHPYSLSQFRGKVIVLSFLYTQCPDACPITAELLRHADELAGHPQDVEYVAVSVDPFHDNAATIAAFSQEHHLDELGGRFHYLIGALPELAPVWQRYYGRGGEAAAAEQTIEHISSLYFIDKQGRLRLLTHIDVPAQTLVNNERVLLHR